MPQEDASQTATNKVVAAIDVGANALRMVIAEVSPDGEIEVLERLQRAVRMGQFKGVQTDKKLALYDLTEDIGEQNDVADEHPEVAERIRNIIADLE